MSREQNWYDTLRSKQNDHHFADNIFKCIFLNKFVPKIPIDSIGSGNGFVAHRWQAITWTDDITLFIYA